MIRIKLNTPIFRKTLNFTSVDDYVNGLTLNGLTYGLINTITSQASEMTIVQSKAFRVDPVNRELQMSFNGADFEPIAGGQKETDGGLEAPGIADLQFVFNLQNADGSLSKVGHCDGTTCNDTGKNIFSDFNQNQVNARENNIRSIEIFLVVKSKSKPAKLRGGLYDEKNSRDCRCVRKGFRLQTVNFQGTGRRFYLQGSFYYRVSTKYVKRRFWIIMEIT